MKLELHNLRKSPRSTKKRKRVGRGNASGHGTYATRGQKGQKSRSGVGGLKRLGMRPMLLATPKFKGQKPVRDKYFPVNIGKLETAFDKDARIDAEALLEKNIIGSAKKFVKILGTGKLSKPFTVVADAFSESAKKAIEKAGGKAIIRK